jgi:hypothetical protein
MKYTLIRRCPFTGGGARGRKRQRSENSVAAYTFYNVIAS